DNGEINRQQQSWLDFIISKRAWQSGKVLAVKWQSIARHDLMFAEYFANRPEDLAKWQSTRTRHLRFGSRSRSKVIDLLSFRSAGATLPEPAPFSPGRNGKSRSSPFPRRPPRSTGD